MLDLLLFASLTDPDVKQWVQAVRSVGGRVSTARAALVEKLVKGLKADGVWPLLDRLWLFAAENGMQARMDVRAQVLASAVNGPTFTTNRGYTGDALAAYLDTNSNPGAGGTNYARDNASYGLWVYNDPGVPGSYREMGNDDDIWGEIQFNANGAITAGINQSASPSGIIPPARTGLVMIERTGANATALYRTGAQIGTGSGASVAVANRNFYVLAAAGSGGAAAPTNSGVSAALLGAALGPTLQASLNNRLRTHMTAVGVP
ncbi:MAG: hypothetical protein J0J01_05075 [Reyranella sp.]|uniref:hypothetical protein n=1 Tax=Reyranella sp. TaxID=1929291 RepID=UPI001AD0DD5C|nr:hypothetical protein [Reyranella sp.]MBN9086257.1 hypothetical protein [Reyranella sp.]